MRKCLAVVLLAASTLQAADGSRTALDEGRALMKQGDFESAVLKLDEATRALGADPTRSRELADAYLYLGITFVELNQEQNAKAKFREVLKKEPQRVLSATEYSQQVIRVFEVARQELYPKKKNRFLPILLIAGGGTAAAAGVAIAASGDDTPPTTAIPATTTTSPPSGGGGGTTTTTTTTVPNDPGGPTATPTPTTLPGATPTPVGPTATPSPTPTGPTATSTPTPVGPTATPTATPVGPTATPTPTPPPTPTPTPACTYTLSPPVTQFTTLGGNGQCQVTTQPGCTWTAVKDGDAGANWVTFTGATSGSGSGTVPYNVGILAITQRTARVFVTQNPADECVINQALAIPPPEGSATWESVLLVDGARGQVVFDGSLVRYVESGHGLDALPGGSGRREVVAQLVTARGKPGTWTFRLPARARPGSLRPVAGQTALLTDDSITFALQGKAGERVVFSFELVP